MILSCCNQDISNHGRWSASIGKWNEMIEDDRVCMCVFDAVKKDGSCDVSSSLDEWRSRGVCYWKMTWLPVCAAWNDSSALSCTSLFLFLHHHHHPSLLLLLLLLLLSFSLSLIIFFFLIYIYFFLSLSVWMTCALGCKRRPKTITQLISRRGGKNGSLFLILSNGFWFWSAVHRNVIDTRRYNGWMQT